MYRTTFPDLNWLKQRTGQVGDGPEQVWPHCVLNVRTQQAHRPDVRGPFSLFLNLKGSSYCEVERHQIRLENDRYFISNSRQHYSLEIDSPEPVETLNIHFREHFCEDVYHSLTTPSQQLLAQPDLHLSRPALGFFNHSYPRTPAFERMIQQLQHELRQGVDSLREEELLTQLMVYLLQSHQDLLRKMQRLPALKHTTREELLHRLSLALDWLHSYYEQELSLDQLAAVAMMSKYHFLRAFQACWGQTPYQYLLNLRLQKAQKLLSQTQLPVTWIAHNTGFKDSNSFARSFKQKTGLSPQAYRAS